MAVPVACPHCGHFLSLSDEKNAAVSGKSAKCNKCGKPFIVQRAVAPTTATANESPQAAQPAPAVVQPAPVVVQYADPSPAREAPVDIGREKDIWSANPSMWIGFSTFFWCGLFSLFCIILAFWLSKWALLGVVWFAVIAGLRVLRIKSIHYHLTSQRLRVTKGVLNRKIVEIELFRVRDLTIEQGFIQRLLTLGTVKAVSTDEDLTTILLSGIRDAMTVKENLRKYVMESRKATGTRDLDMSPVR